MEVRGKSVGLEAVGALADSRGCERERMMKENSIEGKWDDRERAREATVQKGEGEDANGKGHERRANGKNLTHFRLRFKVLACQSEELSLARGEARGMRSIGHVDLR